MLDHVTIGVSDVERSKAFYDQALRPLGIERLYAEAPTFAGYGADRKAFFWIGLRNASQTSTHVAFTAQGQGNRGAISPGGARSRRTGQRATGAAPALSRKLLWGLYP
jgi:catechol 2,3-dioxygenase-like lactoylglutathione lyase family enzyme